MKRKYLITGIAAILLVAVLAASCSKLEQGTTKDNICGEGRERGQQSRRQDGEQVRQQGDGKQDIGQDGNVEGRFERSRNPEGNRIPESDGGTYESSDIRSESDSGTYESSDIRSEGDGCTDKGSDGCSESDDSSNTGTDRKADFHAETDDSTDAGADRKADLHAETDGSSDEGSDSDAGPRTQLGYGDDRGQACVG